MALPSIGTSHHNERGTVAARAQRYYTAVLAGVLAVAAAATAAALRLQGVGGGLAPHSAGRWLAFLGSCGPVVAALSVLRRTASGDAMRGQTARRLHTSMVLTATFSAGALAHSAVTLAQQGPLRAVALSGLASAGFLAAAAGGALLYLPFDLPTALSLWLVPRGAKFRLWWMPETLGVFVAWLVLLDAAATLLAAVSAADCVAAPWPCLLLGLRGAFSTSAGFCLLAFGSAWPRGRMRWACRWLAWGFWAGALAMVLAAAVAGAARAPAAAGSAGPWLRALLWLAAASLVSPAALLRKLP